MFEYTHIIEVFDRNTTLKRVNELAAKGWRFMFVVGNVYWFERSRAVGSLQSAVGSKQAVKKSAVKSVAKKK